MEATVRNEPSARYFSDAAIDFAVTDSADEAVAEVKSVNGLQLASHLSAVDHELALHEYGPTAAATALHALSTVPPVDETTVFPAAATVLAVHECKSNPVPTSYVNCSPNIGQAMWKSDRPDCHADPPAPAPAADMQQRPGQENADDDRCTVVQPSERFRPDVQRFAPTLRDHADAGITESMAVDAAVVDPIPNEQADFSDPRIQRSTVTVKVVHERNSNPADDVTIAGGVKSTNVTVFAADPDPTVRNAVRDSRHAAPCHLQSGFDMLASTAPSVRACFVTGLECPNMPSGVLLDARFSVSLTV
jgi:hypothetical protein